MTQRSWYESVSGAFSHQLLYNKSPEMRTGVLFIYILIFFYLILLFSLFVTFPSMSLKVMIGSHDPLSGFRLCSMVLLFLLDSDLELMSNVEHLCLTATEVNRETGTLFGLLEINLSCLTPNRSRFFVHQDFIEQILEMQHTAAAIPTRRWRVGFTGVGASVFLQFTWSAPTGRRRRHGHVDFKRSSS